MNLDEFIQKRSDDGTLESVGDFTVDSLAALRKTLASALPEPHFYLFQVLQALVQIRARDIKVGVGRRENKISFKDTGGTFSNPGDLVTHFNKALSVSSNDPLDLLMSGMTTSLGSHVTCAELLHGKDKVSVNVDGAHHSTLPDSREPTVIFRRTMEKGLSFSWSTIWGARKEEFRVRKAFEHSPVPISIAGLPTSPHSGWRRVVDGHDHYALLEVAVLDPQAPNHRGEPQPDISRVEGSPFLYRCGAPETGPDGSELAVAPNLLMLALNTDLEPITRDLTPGEWDTRDWTLCFTSHTDQPGEILFVRNGYSVERETHDLGFKGLQVVAPADDLSVDASGYQLVRNASFLQRIEQAKKLAQTVRKTVTSKELEDALKKLGRDAHQVLGQFSWG